MPSTIPRASMNDEQWVSTFGTANNIGQEVEGEFKQTQEGNTDSVSRWDVVYEALLKIRRIYRVRIDWV